MPFAAALSTSSHTLRAIDEVCERALEQFQGTPDLACVFVSPHHAMHAEDVGPTIQERLRARVLIGSTGESIVANEREIEQQSAIAVWLARWDTPVLIDPFHLTIEQTAKSYSFFGWPDSIIEVDPAHAVVLTMGDPFTFPMDACLKHVNDTYANLRVVGGMASGANAPGENRLFLNNRVLDHGAAGVLLHGPVAARTVVSQGCRPIGRAFLVTKAQQNIVLSLGGKTPLEQLQEMWNELTPLDQRLVQQGLHLGIAFNEYQGEFRRGDFLVRNVMGIDRTSGAMAITDHARVGQTVQFHVRDADSAHEDLQALLETQAGYKPSGALLFTCNGRGTRLFSGPHHDVSLVRAAIGAVPVAGFFAAGEIGPIGGNNFIHGFTASVVLFD